MGKMMITARTSGLNSALSALTKALFASNRARL